MEKIGSMLKQPKEEPMKDEEALPEEPVSPESYNEAEWERLKNDEGMAAWAIMEGRKMGVPQDEIDRFAENVIMKALEGHDYGTAYRFRKNMGIGTREQLRAVAEESYHFYVEKNCRNVRNISR